MKCKKCKFDYDAKLSDKCPNCGAPSNYIKVQQKDLAADLRDLEKADGILRMFSRIFLMLSIVGSIGAFLLMSHHGGRQLFIALFVSIGILCLGVLVWAIGNVLANISCNIRQIAHK